MKKFGLGLLWLTIIVLFANGWYVLLFTDESDTFRVLSIFETTKIPAGLAYFALAGLLYYALRKENK
jgi:hypothetical protein